MRTKQLTSNLILRLAPADLQAYRTAAEAAQQTLSAWMRHVLGKSARRAARSKPAEKEKLPDEQPGETQSKQAIENGLDKPNSAGY